MFSRKWTTSKLKRFMNASMKAPANNLKCWRFQSLQEKKQKLKSSLADLRKTSLRIRWQSRKLLWSFANLFWPNSGEKISQIWRDCRNEFWSLFSMIEKKCDRLGKSYAAFQDFTQRMLAQMTRGASNFKQTAEWSILEVTRKLYWRLAERKQRNRPQRFYGTAKPFA